MHLFLSPAHIAMMQTLAADAYPEECCGLLVGVDAADGVRVVDVAPADNTAEDRCRQFAIDAQYHFDLLRALRGTGRRIVGHYHSHPEGASAPSVHDAAMAHDPEMIWIVIGVAGGLVAAPAAFVPDGAGFRELQIRG